LFELLLISTFLAAKKATMHFFKLSFKKVYLMEISGITNGNFALAIPFALDLEMS